MSTKVQDGLTVFKLHVASLEFDGDTLALDRALAASSELLYDVRRAIDFEWAETRAARTPVAQSKVASLEALGITEAQLEAALASIRKENPNA